MLCLMLLAALCTQPAHATDEPIWQASGGQNAADPFTACQTSTNALDSQWFLKQVEFQYVVYGMFNIADCYGGNCQGS